MIEPLPPHNPRQGLDWEASPEYRQLVEQALQAQYGSNLVEPVIWMPGPSDAQEAGQDIVAAFLTGYHKTLQVKVRRENWPDFALEIVSNDRILTPGWMEKRLNIHTLIYILQPSRLAHFLPYPSLWKAYCQNREVWFARAASKAPADRGFRFIGSLNETDRGREYGTWSLVVPQPVLIQAVDEAAGESGSPLRCDFKRF